MHGKKGDIYSKKKKPKNGQTYKKRDVIHIPFLFFNIEYLPDANTRPISMAYGFSRPSNTARTAPELGHGRFAGALPDIFAGKEFVGGLSQSAKSETKKPGTARKIRLLEFLIRNE